jgi:hypothetical protein
MDRVPNSVPVRLKAMAGGDHPDPDQLAALAEQALPERERAQVLLHLSRCADCREVLALAVPPVAAQSSPSLDTAKRPWFQWRTLRWAGAAACVVIVGSAVLMKREAMMSRSEPTAVAPSDAKSSSLPYERASEPASPPAATVQEQSSGSISTNGKLAAKLPPAPTGNKLAAKLPPTEEREMKKALDKGEFAYSRKDSDGLTAKSGAFLGSAGAQGAAVGGVVGSVTAPAPAAQPSLQESTNGELSAKPDLASKERLKELPSQGRNVSALTNLAPRGAAETVQVEAAAPAVQAESAPDAKQLRREAPGKAKASANSMTLNEVASERDRALDSYAAPAAKEPARDRVAAYSPLSRWTISSDGHLQHSIDAGKTWQPVTVAEGASFRALSANGPDLWVGGAGGLLYHSPDAGNRWIQVKPVDGDATLAADIAAIEFTDTRHGKVTAANGEIWTTTDGGQNWRKQP